MMGSRKILYYLCMINVSILTLSSAARAAKIEIPPCPPETQRIFMPSAAKPVWTGCKDKKGLYQGLLIQFSNQTEILRVAGIKNSLRNGKEIRYGLTGQLEERHYLNGHLEKSSFVFKSDSTLGRLMPKPMTAKDWAAFNEPSDVSVLKWWLKHDPESTTQFENGRLVRLQYGSIDYKFKITPEGRILPTNHPELKKVKGMFFVDPEPLWLLNADDMKKALLPGFGSCKKYSGPIGRYTRYYDHYLFKREASESKQLLQLMTIRERLIKFCVPEDIFAHLGTIECPPQLPTTRTPHFCAIPISDRLHLPYQPKYFKNEFTFERTPEEFLSIAVQNGLLQFAGDFEKRWDVLKLSPEIQIVVKKSSRGIVFKMVKKDAKGKLVVQEPSENDKAWWEWTPMPGFSSY
jgi:hypothetical protein